MSARGNLTGCVLALVVACSGCKKDEGPNLDRPVIGLNCGDPTSPGNSVGVGKYCETSHDCPVASEGTTIQCSTVLTDDRLPLVCSRLCEDMPGGAPVDCGEDAVCHHIAELGYDLFVCVPHTCAPIFSDGLPGVDAGTTGGMDGGG